MGMIALIALVAAVHGANSRGRDPSLWTDSKTGSRRARPGEGAKVSRLRTGQETESCQRCEANTKECVRSVSVLRMQLLLEKDAQLRKWQASARVHGEAACDSWAPG
jgi:hypothetical protein